MTDKHEPDVLDEVIEEVQDVVSDFLNREAAPGILLMGATILALIIANSPLDTLYDHLISMPVQISAGTWAIDKPLLLWINDGLMAVFFFHVGLELKREICEGELANPKDIILPAAGAGPTESPSCARYQWHVQCRCLHPWLLCLHHK